MGEAVQGQPLSRWGIGEVPTDGLGRFACEFDIGVEEGFEDEVECVAVVDAGEDVDEDAFLDGAGLLKKVAELADGLATGASEDGGGAQLELQLVGFEEGKNMGDDIAGADGLKGFEDVAGGELVGLWQGCGEGANDGGVFRFQLGQNDGGGTTSHAVGTLEQGDDALKLFFHSAMGRLSDVGMACNGMSVRVKIRCMSVMAVQDGVCERAAARKMTLTELRQIYHLPFFELVERARRVFLEHWVGDGVQLCELLSIKTGGCSEDCAYCAQSARYNTGVRAEPLKEMETVLAAAQEAKARGATRFCMGAAWRGVREGTAQFEAVLEMCRQVSRLGLEVCVTLGLLSAEAARQLKAAGVTAYNHNLDTSPEFYPRIVTTHRFEDRLATIRHAQAAGLAVCCGGIIGMGESVEDRLRMLEVLVGLEPPPESVPINCLMPIPGTPLEGQSPVDVFELIRLIATTRLALPRARVRLSAGRTQLTREAQAWCFYAGANSIFFGSKLLTAANPTRDEDLRLLAELGLRPQPVRCDPVRPTVSLGTPS